MSSQYRQSQANHVRQSNIIGTNNTMYNVESGNDRKIFTLRENRISAFLPSDDQQFNSTIQVSSFFAWIILILNCLFSAFVPCWLMGDLQTQVFTRNSWRYTAVVILLLPFLMYEQRNVTNQNDKLINCLTKEKLKPIFVSAINYSLWLLILVSACRWTSMNHAICLSDLKILVITLLKLKRKQKFHEFQMGGSLIAIFGIILLFTDSITLPQIDKTSELYLRTEPWKRLILGDGLAILGSFASYHLDKYFTKPEMPRFTYLFIYHIFIIFNMITFGYFFGGSQFSFNTKYGVFGLYTYVNFVSVFYVSIMLGVTLIMTNILVRQIFSELIINIASRFQIIQISIIYHVLKLQLVPSGLTCLGYSFLVPGLVFILAGQASLENKQSKFNMQLYKPQQLQRLTKQKQQNDIVYPASVPPSTSIKKMPFLQILEQQEHNHHKSAGQEEHK